MPYVSVGSDEVEHLKLRSGDIVIARIGATTGKAFLISDCPDSVFASYLIRLRTCTDLLPEYLKLCLQTRGYWQQIDSNKGGRLLGGVNIPILTNIEISLPPFHEQKRIASSMHTIRNAITLRRKELCLEVERMVALRDSLLRLGLSGDTLKETEIGSLPQSWTVTSIERVCESLDHKRVPVKSNDRNAKRGTTPYYGASGQTGWIEGYLFDEPLLLLAEDGENLVSRKLPIAYSIAGKSWVNNHAHVLRAIGINQKFLEFYLNSIDLTPYLTG